MEISPEVALATVFTAGGSPVWAAAIMAVVQVFKGVPQFASVVAGREKLLAFILSGVLVVAAFAAALTAQPPGIVLDIVGIVAGILAWFAIARLAMALYDDTQAQKSESVVNPSGWTGEG